MISEFLDIKSDESLPELCERLGRFLGLDEPVEVQVLLRAIDDPMYASHLITCRNTPGFLMALLNDPKNQAYALPQAQSAAQHAAPSNLALIRKASTAFLSWGKAGFSIVDEATLQCREEACLSCPNRSQPVRLLQKMVASREDKDQVGKRLGSSVCTLCGCNVSRKIKLPSESCPDRHPAQPGLTRWGEPMAT